MPESVTDLLRRWDTTASVSADGEPFNQLHKRLTFLAGTHFAQYVPTIGPDDPDYETRLERWLANVKSDAEKQLLLELALNQANSLG